MYNRNIIKIILLLSTMFSLNFQCGKENNPTGILYVKNCTDHNLYMNYPPYSFKQCIKSGDSIYLYATSFPTEYGVIFDAVFSKWRKAEPPLRYQDKEACKVLSEDGRLLKQWNFTDRNLYSKQFFNESAWRYYYEYFELYSNQTYFRATWVFDILPEDLIEEEDDNNDII